MTGSSNKTIAKNTIMLYLRMMVNMTISLYTSRVVLQTLGVVDFGIYGVVGGVVSMFMFFNNSMAGATSRFLTYELGCGDLNKLKEIFSSALILHIGIALLIFLLSETIGVWFLENKLVIPVESLDAARWVLQFSILTMMINVMQVPFNASIISHERMDYFAYVEILNSVLRLLIVYLLVIGDFDKLKLYAILTCAVSTVIAIIYRFICVRNFEECHFKFVWNPLLFKSMLSFSGWNFYGEMSLIAITQGVNMLLNMWFGPVMNAASDIAARVQGIVMNLSTNVSTAVRPQVVKCYSQQEFPRMLSLMRNGARITFLLMLLFTAPLMIEAHYILNLWLGVVPEHTETLLQFSLMWNLTVAMSVTLNFVVQASGDVKFQSLLSGSLYLSVLPLTYIAFKMDAPYWIPYLLKVLTVFTAVFVSCHTIKKHVPDFSFVKMVMPDLVRAYIVLIMILSLTYILTLLIEESFVRLVVSTLFSATLICICGYYIILPKNIRDKVLMVAKNKILNRD